jgi:hypothetical protein
MPDVQVTAIGGRAIRPDEVNDDDQNQIRDNGERSILSDEGEPEDKDDAAPGSLEWKEQG